MFLLEDANLIERFADRFIEASVGPPPSPPKETLSVYSNEGESLRRKSLSQMAAGETSESLLSLFGFNSQTGELDPFETRDIEVLQPDGSVSTNRARVRKQPIARGPRTAFTNNPIASPFFSAYRNDKGILRLYFMSEVENQPISQNGSGGGGIQLQCCFSVDDGLNWYDQWEYITFGMNRMRVDSISGIPYIDKTANGSIPPENLDGEFPIGQEDHATFGINLHWSRLKKHKIQEGEITPDSESQIIEIESPYAFYQSATKKVFLFYIYQNCLLCKIFDDEIFSNVAARRRQNQAGMKEVKEIIEKSTRSHFVDGFLNQPEVLSELHDKYNEPTEERLIDGNIVFKYQHAIEKFDESRTISGQRVCAHELPSGMIRVFYKFRGINTLKSAIWIGNEFWAEDFLKDKTIVGSFVPSPSQGGTPVRGGFGEEAF